MTLTSVGSVKKDGVEIVAMLNSGLRTWILKRV